MKSHLEILKTQQKIEQTLKLLQDETESEDEELKSRLYYGLRDNPKKSFKLVDPVFTSIVLDKESETESFKSPSTITTTRRRRSKRNRLPIVSNHHQIHQEQNYQLKKFKSIKPIKIEYPIESEPVSSVSNNTIEEDLAICLMMLSRDSWVKVKKEETEKSIEEFDHKDEVRKKYQCESCKKVFRSYQALGEHRANHKKINGCIVSPSSTIKAVTTQNRSNVVGRRGDGRIHKCPVCFRMFKSKQALGGHKRIHFSHLSTTTTTSDSVKLRENLIDLNLPAPIENEEQITQLDISSHSQFIDL